jgi:hypothetical protein
MLLLSMIAVRRPGVKGGLGRIGHERLTIHSQECTWQKDCWRYSSFWAPRKCLASILKSVNDLSSERLHPSERLQGSKRVTFRRQWVLTV